MKHIFIFLLLLAVPVFGQVKTTKSNKKAAKNLSSSKIKPEKKTVVETPQSKVTETPQPEDVKVLSGQDLHSFCLYFETIKKEFEKSDSETESEYLARLEKLGSTKTYQGTRFENLAFSTEPWVQYSDHDTLYKITYPLLTASQARITVLNRTKESWTPKMVSYTDYSFEIMSPEREAKNLEQKYRMAFFGIPITARFAESFSDLGIAVKEIYIYDADSGEVYENSRRYYTSFLN